MIPKAPLVALLALAPVTVALAATPRVEVPIQQSVLAGGAPRYWVMLSIADGEPSRAMLDTGSTGLRVLAAAVPPTGVTRTDASKTYGYTSGAEYDGVIARARISLGAAQTKDDFPFQLIDKAGCSKAKPNCPVLKVAAKDYRIGGRGAQGFMIILGANMAASDAPNPLAAMADSWIIELPRPGSSQPGRLILNPNDADRAGFSKVQLDPVFANLKAGFHDSVPGCVRTVDRAQSVCGPMLLDSGAPQVEIAFGASTKPQDFKTGASAAVVIAPVEGPPLVAPFTVGRGLAANLETHPGEGQPRNRISAGVLPFYAFSVLYEPHTRFLGLKPRQPDTAATETP